VKQTHRLFLSARPGTEVRIRFLPGWLIRLWRAVRFSIPEIGQGKAGSEYSPSLRSRLLLTAPSDIRLWVSLQARSGPLSAIPLRPSERRSPSDRNDLRVHNGMVFRFAREPQIPTIVDISPLTAFETSCFDEECRTASLLSQWMGFSRTF